MPVRIEDLDADPVASASGRAKKAPGGHPARLAVRHEADAGQVVGDAALEIDRLPDAGERPVPALLAERDLGEGRVRELGRVVGRRIDPHLDLVAAGLEEGGDVEGEGQEAALVGADQLAVDADPGVVEHGAEAQPDAVADPVLGDVDGAAVDADAGAHAQVGELRLPGAGTVIWRTSAGPDRRSSATWRNSHVPSRLMRESRMTSP